MLEFCLGKLKLLEWNEDPITSENESSSSSSTVNCDVSPFFNNALHTKTVRRCLQRGNWPFLTTSLEYDKHEQNQELWSGKITCLFLFELIVQKCLLEFFAMKHLIVDPWYNNLNDLVTSGCGRRTPRNIFTFWVTPSVSIVLRRSKKPASQASISSSKSEVHFFVPFFLFAFKEFVVRKMHKMII